MVEVEKDFEFRKRGHLSNLLKQDLAEPFAPDYV